MKPPAPSSRSLRDLRELTPARVGLGRAGASMPTEALLAFTLDHARARDAVHGAFDTSRLVEGLTNFG
ncbi:MAG: ethanolamine ammonia-lyase light chain EutC, partial [Bradyrhizobium sp.]